MNEDNPGGKYVKGDNSMETVVQDGVYFVIGL